MVTTSKPAGKKFKRTWPPLFAGYTPGKKYVDWKGLGILDVDLVGNLLFTHMVIEHYLDQYLLCRHGKGLNFESAKLTFGQKLSLLEGAQFPTANDFRPALKHLNSLRNSAAHQILAGPGEINVLPLVHFLDKGAKGPHFGASAVNVLNDFASRVCAYLAANINLHHLGKDHNPLWAFEWWVWCGNLDRQGNHINPIDKILARKPAVKPRKK